MLSTGNNRVNMLEHLPSCMKGYQIDMKVRKDNSKLLFLPPPPPAGIARSV
jgi:hypothetical protein